MEAICDECKAKFEVKLHSARKGELRAKYLQCPVCYVIYPTYITDQALRRLIRDSSSTGFPYHKKRRERELKAEHGESLKQMDGWTEEA